VFSEGYRLKEIDLDELREEILQCRRCGICRNAVYEAKGFDGICPIWKNTSGFEPSFMRGKIQVALALLDKKLERNSVNAESLFQCTLCGNCAEICGAEFHPAQVIETVRAVLERDIPNEARDRIAQGVLERDNPYNEDATKKRNWVSRLDFTVAEHAKTLFFAGCTASLRRESLALNTAKILKAAGEQFMVMKEEPCCGSVLLRTGAYDKAEENAMEVARRVEETGVERIIVSCAGCMKTLQKDYSERFGIEMPEVLHIAQSARQLLDQGKLRLKDYLERIKVTYHDPCHIGRELGIYDEPRQILESIPRVEFVEMSPTRETSICCGAGGGLRSYDPTLSKKIAADRIRSAEKTQADAIVSACPFCESNFEEGREAIGSTMGVLDLVDILAESLDK
jgi:heterodisulfide reductase subunit D